MRKITALTISFILLFSFAAAAAPSDWAKNEIASELELLFADRDFSAPVTKSSMAELLLCAYIELGGKAEIKAENPYTDLNEPLVLIADRLGLVKGETATEFVPGKELTRFEVLEAIYNAVGVNYTFTAADKENFAASYLSSDFFDENASDKEKLIIGYALSNRLVRGMPDGTLSLDSICTLEQAAVFVSRGLMNGRA